jgi:hypothetical protein
MSKNNVKYYLIYINDGQMTVPITVWVDVYNKAGKEMLKEGKAIRLGVDYDSGRDAFKVSTRASILFLEPIKR